MHNFLMAQTQPAYEFRVQRAIDELTGMDSSYCPMEPRYHTISRRAGLKRVVMVPVLPRLVFFTASFPDLASVASLRGCEGIVMNDFGLPVVIPGWEMREFMQQVEIYRLRAIHQQMRARAKPGKTVIRGLPDAMKYLAEKAGEREEMAA